MSTTPKDPSGDGRAPQSSPSPIVPSPAHPNVEQTLFGVAPAIPPQPAAPPAPEAVPLVTTTRPALASESAIVAAPVIAVSDDKAAPSSPQSSTAPVRARGAEPQLPVDSESNRTALSSDYLHAARELALGQPGSNSEQRAPSQALQPLPIAPSVDRKTLPPAPFAPTAAAAEFAVAPSPAVGAPAQRNEPHNYATQRSVAPPALSDLPPLAPGLGVAPSPAPATSEPPRPPGRSIASTMFDPPPDQPALPALTPALPALAPDPLDTPVSVGGPAPAFATRFEPVPAPRAALSEQMLGAFAPPPAIDPVAPSSARASARVISSGRRSPALRAGVAGLVAIALAGMGFLIFSDKSPIGDRLRTAWSGQPEQAPMTEAVSDDAIRAQMLSNRAASELPRPSPPASAPVVDALPEPTPSSVTGSAGSPTLAKTPGQVSVSFASDDKTKAKGKTKSSHKAKAKRHKATAKPATSPPSN